MAWYHKLFGLCEHDWEEAGREYNRPLRSFKNVTFEQAELYVQGWTLFKYHCPKCDKRTYGQQVGDWTKQGADEQRP